MNHPHQLAKAIREVHFGGNWTASCLKQHLAGVSREEALRKVRDLNTIAMLAFHINYYVDTQLGVLRGGPLTSKDSLSYAHGPLDSEADWQALLEKMWRQAEELAALVEQLPEERMGEDFMDAKYGSWYRNLQGMVEHTHYHLGQIVLVKKLVRS